MILDIVLVALVILCYITGAKKGFVKSIWKTIAWIMSIILVWAFSAPFLQYASQTEIYQKLYAFVGDKLSVAYEGGMSQMPAYVGFIAEESGQVVENAATALAEVITNMCAYIVLFILIRLLVGIVLWVLDMLSKLPVISFTNSVAGGLLGVINIMFVVEIALALMTMFTINGATELIDSSVVVSYLYNNNILLKFFM